MRQGGITEILTYDDHFTQEGFVILLSQDFPRAEEGPRKMMPR